MFNYSTSQLLMFGVICLTLIVLLNFGKHNNLNYVTIHSQHFYLMPSCHMLPTIGKSLSVISEGDNSQRILLLSNH